MSYHDSWGRCTFFVAESDYLHHRTPLNKLLSECYLFDWSYRYDRRGWEALVRHPKLPLVPDGNRAPSYTLDLSRRKILQPSEVAFLQLCDGCGNVVLELSL